ncbi:MAG: hypothetical protein ACP5N1_05665 [Candidatus Woesearchaeota archaeon]
MGFFRRIWNFITRKKEDIVESRISSRGSTAISELNRVVAEYQQIKPERDKARVNATQFKTILDRQTDRVKLSDMKDLVHLEQKEIKQFERKVTRQLWDLRRMIFNLNIIIKTEYHEMLLEVQKPLRAYSNLLDEFEDFFSNRISVANIDIKNIDNIKKHFESMKNNYNTLVENMLKLTKHELTPVSVTNSSVTAQHMQERSNLRKTINQTTVVIRAKFVAMSKELKKIKQDPTNTNQILLTCLDNTKTQFDSLLTLFNQRGMLAKKMVLDSQKARADALKDIIELKAVLDQFYIDMRSKNITEDQNKIMGQLKAWEERNKAELNKDAYILAEEEQEQIKITEETKTKMVEMRNAFVAKTNGIILAISSIYASLGVAAAGNNNIINNNIATNGKKTNVPPVNIPTNEPNHGNTMNNDTYLGRRPNNNTPNSRWDGTSPRVMNNDPTNLLNRDGLMGNDSRILPERPAADTAPKTGVLGWFRKKIFTNIMAAVFAFNLAGPTVANYTAIRNATPISYNVTVNDSNYYKEEIILNDIKSSEFIFSTKFDNKEGMVSKTNFENNITKQIVSLIEGRADSIRTAKFGDNSQYVVKFHPEKSVISGTTCPSGITRKNLKTGESNESLRIKRADEGRKSVDKVINNLVNDSTFIKASNAPITLNGVTIFDDDVVESAAIALNNYAISVNRPDLVSNPKEVRKKNMTEVTKFDKCILLMSQDKNVKSEYEKNVKGVMNPLRGVNPKLFFTIEITKKPVGHTPTNIPIMPVAASSEREFIEDTESVPVVPADKPKYKRPTNEKIKPQDWRNVKTKGGGNTRVRPGSTAFRSGRTGSRGDMNRGRNR